MKFSISPKLIFFTAPFFAVSFVLSVYLANIHEVTLGYLVSPFVTVTLFAMLSEAVLRGVLGEQKGTLAASFFVILFFSYRELFALTDKLRIASFLRPAENDLVIFIIWFSIVEILFLVVKNTSKNTIGINRFLLAVSVVATFIPALTIAKYEMERPRRSGETEKNSLQAKTVPARLPDIYYIVPDSYSAPWVMKKYFGCDIGDFPVLLEKKGFYVPRDYTSNYPKTFLSLASTLNMEYLDSLSRYGNSPDQSLTKPMIENNKAMRFVKSLGYRYYQIGSWFDMTNHNPYADYSYSFAGGTSINIGEFGSAVLAATMAKPIGGMLLSASQNPSSIENRRQYTLYEFEKLSEIAKNPGPKFVFVHMLAPHTPYAFDENCGTTDYRYFSENDENKAYCNQVKCVNKKIEETVDSILSDYGAGLQPIIIVQSDEGSTFLRYRIGAKNCRGDDCWSEASDSLLQQKFPVFAAYYLPGAPEADLYPAISGVNSFRVIFNAYFGVGLPLLPDKNYIFPDDNHCYDFKEVTATVRAGMPGDPGN